MSKLSKIFMEFATARTGRSMARALLCVLVFTFCHAAIVQTHKHGFNEHLARVFTYLGGFLGSVWFVSKTKWSKDVQEEP